MATEQPRARQERHDPPPRLGFVGLGAMGGRMARSLLKARYSLTGYDINAERLAACVQAGARAANDSAQVVHDSDIVLSCLVAHVYVEVAERELLPQARAGQIFIDHSTVPPPETRRLAAAFCAKGAVSIDAPVSGWITGAESGTLSVFIGGDERTVRRCWPIFEAVGKRERLIYGGPAGTGQVMKAVQQMRNRLVDAARLEVMSFGVRAGLEMDLVLRVLDAGPDDPYAKLAQRIRAGEADQLNCLSTEWAYYLAESRARGFRMPMLEALQALNERGERISRDEQGRWGISVWRELMKDAPAKSLSP
jgi:3-hydroxyisobutyrate dehydrogenase-like beta-hydroxyacid dehydrogenase